MSKGAILQPKVVVIWRRTSKARRAASGGLKARQRGLGAIWPGNVGGNHGIKFSDCTLKVVVRVHSLWPPCVADANIIFLPCGFFLLSFSLPNLSGRRLDVYHTSTHGPCPVSERLAKRLSKKIQFIRINWTARISGNFCLANRSLTGHAHGVVL